MRVVCLNGVLGVCFGAHGYRSFLCVAGHVQLLPRRAVVCYNPIWGFFFYKDKVRVRDF